MKSILAVMLTTFGFTLIYLAMVKTNQGESTLSSIDTGSALSIAIQEDLKNLALKKELPAEWASIREEHYVTTSRLTEQWVKKANPNIAINPSGHYRIEYTLIAENPSEQKSRLLIQYGLYDIKSSNKIWEKIRIYNP